MSSINIRLAVAFDGSSYSGWQKQKNAKSVQAALEEALSGVLREKVRVIGAGRTDAGAHAIRFTLNFTVSRCLIPLPKLPGVVNAKLPPSIRVLDAAEARPDFHARFSATAREYVYFLSRRDGGQPAAGLSFLGRYCYEYSGPMDADILKAACAIFTGRHDFRNFCYGYSGDKDFRREIFYFRCRPVRVLGAEIWVFFIKGSGFLKGMIRSIISACLQAAAGVLTTEQVRAALDSRKGLHSRNRSPVPASGLYFKRAYYGGPGAAMDQ